jgi:hypothetical protein
VYHLLLVASHHKASYDIMFNVYHELLILGEQVKLHSLERFGKEFDKVVPMDVN